jgi:hypothetical protein
MGDEEFGTLSSAWQEWVAERLADWNPAMAAELPGAMARLAPWLFDEQSVELVTATAQ